MSLGRLSMTPVVARVADVYEDGQDARHFTFALLEDLDRAAFACDTAPGQFFMLTVPGTGEAPFTFVTLPNRQGRFDALVRRVGKLTDALFALPRGALVGVRGPFGQPWPLRELAGQRVLVLAGGCGLAPLAAAIDELARVADPRVIFGAREPAAQVLAQERAAWRERLPFMETFDVPSEGVARVGTPLRWVDEALDGQGPEAVLTCGPEVMMNAVGEAMVARGVAPERIFLSLERRMHCGGGLCGHCYLGSSYVCTNGPTYRWDELCRLRAQSVPRSALPREVRSC